MRTGKDAWTMPGWMEKYRDLFQNTGGNTIERLMNIEPVDTWGNVILAALCVSVASQVTLLHRLKDAGFIETVAPKPRRLSAEYLNMMDTI